MQSERSNHNNLYCLPKQLRNVKLLYVQQYQFGEKYETHMLFLNVVNLSKKLLYGGGTVLMFVHTCTDLFLWIIIDEVCDFKNIFRNLNSKVCVYFI